MFSFRCVCVFALILMLFKNSTAMNATETATTATTLNVAVNTTDNMNSTNNPSNAKNSTESVTPSTNPSTAINVTETVTVATMPNSSIAANTTAGSNISNVDTTNSAMHTSLRQSTSSIEKSTESSMSETTIPNTQLSEDSMNTTAMVSTEFEQTTLVTISVNCTIKFSDAWETSFANTSSAEFKEKCEELIDRISNTIKDQMNSLSEIKCIKLSPGSIEMFSEYAFKQSASESLEEQAKQLRSNLLSTLNDAPDTLRIEAVTVYDSDGNDIENIKSGDSKRDWDVYYQIIIIVLVVVILVLLLIVVVQRFTEDSPNRYGIHKENTYYVNKTLDGSFESPPDLKQQSTDFSIPRVEMKIE